MVGPRPFVRVRHGSDVYEGKRISVEGRDGREVTGGGIKISLQGKAVRRGRYRLGIRIQWYGFRLK